MIWYHLNLYKCIPISILFFDFIWAASKNYWTFPNKVDYWGFLVPVKTIFIEELLIIKMPGFSKQKTHFFAISHYLSNIFKWYRHPFTFGGTFSYIFHRAVTSNWHLETLHHRGFERSDALSYRPMGAECWTIPWIPWGKHVLPSSGGPPSAFLFDPTCVLTLQCKMSSRQCAGLRGGAPKLQTTSHKKKPTVMSAKNHLN